MRAWLYATLLGTPSAPPCLTIHLLSSSVTRLELLVLDMYVACARSSKKKTHMVRRSAGKGSSKQHSLWLSLLTSLLLRSKVGVVSPKMCPLCVPAEKIHNKEGGAVLLGITWKRLRSSSLHCAGNSYNRSNHPNNLVSCIPRPICMGTCLLPNSSWCGWVWVI